MSQLISPSKVRRYILDTAAKSRAHKFQRVSARTIAQVDGMVRTYCAQLVKSAPSKGVTL